MLGRTLIIGIGDHKLLCLDKGIGVLYKKGTAKIYGVYSPATLVTESEARFFLNNREDVAETTEMFERSLGKAPYTGPGAVLICRDDRGRARALEGIGSIRELGDSDTLADVLDLLNSQDKQ